MPLPHVADASFILPPSLQRFCVVPSCQSTPHPRMRSLGWCCFVSQLFGLLFLTHSGAAPAGHSSHLPCCRKRNVRHYIYEFQYSRGPNAFRRVYSPVFLCMCIMRRRAMPRSLSGCWRRKWMNCKGDVSMLIRLGGQAQRDKSWRSQSDTTSTLFWCCFPFMLQICILPLFFASRLHTWEGVWRTYGSLHTCLPSHTIRSSCLCPMAFETTKQMRIGSVIGERSGASSAASSAASLTLSIFGFSGLPPAAAWPCCLALGPLAFDVTPPSCTRILLQFMLDRLKWTFIGRKDGMKRISKVCAWVFQILEVQSRAWQILQRWSDSPRWACPSEDHWQACACSAAQSS